MEIGAMIRTARRKANLSQEQAAETLGVSRQTVSNWENGKSYPDILSVIRMSDLYSVSLDRLLKEEDSVKQTYKEYLEESTNVVKSNERKSKLILVLTVLGIWALSFIAFLLAHKGVDDTGYGLALTWAVLPVTFFVSSFIIGKRDWFGKWKWLAGLVFGLMYAMSGSVSSVAAANMEMRSVMWPDFGKLPVGLRVSIAGIVAGLRAEKKHAKE